MKKSKSSVCQMKVLAALVTAATAGMAANAQTNTTNTNARTIEEVVVTGSLLRRSQADMPSPMTVLSGEDLRDAGYSAISDMMKNLTINSGGHFTTTPLACRW